MDGIERIELPTPFGVGTVNCYATCGDGLALVDPGPDAEDTFEALDAGLADLGYDLADVERVLITHEHMDHFGGARRIQADAGADVLAHRVAAERIADPDGHFDREQAFFAPFLVSMGVPEEVAEAVTGLPEPYAKFHEPVDADRVLEDGDVVDVGGDRALEVVHVPGHAPGQVCFASTGDDLAFTADHVLMDITPNPLLTLAPDGKGDVAPADAERTRSLPQYMDSLARVLDVDVSRGYGGHRETIEDLHGRVRETIDHHEERKEHVAELLAAAGPTTAYDVMGELFPNLPTTETFAGMSEVIGHLDLLEDEARVEIDEEDGEVRYRLR